MYRLVDSCQPVSNLGLHPSLRESKTVVDAFEVFLSKAGHRLARPLTWVRVTESAHLANEEVQEMERLECFS